MGDKLNDKTKGRRSSEKSVYTEVDRIFQEFGANRAHYFGRKFEGVDIRKIMDKAIDLFGEQGAITTCLRNHASSDDVKKAVSKVCDEVGESFRLWDAVFKAIHEEDPSTEH